MNLRRLSICLFFRAPLGGLQENVRSTVIAAGKAGWQVSVVCPKGPFIDSLNHLGFETLAVDFDSIDSLTRAKKYLRNASVIHSHPGPSRTLALESASISASPVVFTIHGAWFDNIQDYAHQLAAIVCVSPSVKSSVDSLLGYNNKSCFIPNGVDSDKFNSIKDEAVELGHLAVASRLDSDKRVLVNALISLWEVQSKKGKINSLHYTVAGQGSLQEELKQAADNLRISVRFVGWLDGADLVRLYGRASVVIASGRGAIEALAAGKPTLALASAGIVELFDCSQFSNATFSNFGGYGAVLPESFEDLHDKLREYAFMNTNFFSQEAKDYVRTNHDNIVVNSRLLSLYDRILMKKTN